MTEEIKAWQMAVTKASLTFDSLIVELEGVGDASGTVAFTKDQTSDEWALGIVDGAKLKELHNTRVLTKHVRAMLLFLFGHVSAPPEVTTAVEEPVKKRGRVVKNTQPTTSTPRMRASFANTPIKWDSVTRADTIDTIVAFLE